MKALFSLFLNASLWGSVLILFTLVLRPLLRKAPRHMLCVLWVLVILRLLVPFQFESKLSLQPRFVPSQVITEQSASQPDTPPVQTPNQSVSTPDVTPAPLPDVSVDPIPDVPPVQSETPAEKPAPDPVTVISAVWLSVAGVALLYNLISYLFFLHKVRESIPCADGALESDHIPGAFLLGYWKPKIYLPLGLSQQDRRFIIAHEKVHIRRGDNWWKLLGIICLCIHWYNPLVGISYLLMCRDIEVACDEQVIRTMPLEERKAYSMALLNSGKRMSGFFVASTAFGEISLKQRIKKVLSYRNPALWVTVIGILLVVFAAVGFMTNPVQKPQEPTNNTIIQNTNGNTEGTTDSEATTNSEETTGTEAPDSSTESTSATTQTPALQPTTPSNQTQTAPTNVIASGKWDGGPVTWKITTDGVLTISGNRSVQGAISYIWIDYSDVVTKIVVEDGITTVPNGAFQGMDKVTEVYLGNTVTFIGEKAFSQCTALRAVTIPASVKTISSYAFYDCRGMTTLEIAPNSQLETIQSYAFAKSSITAFSSPASLHTIETKAFENCEFLQSVILRDGVQEVKAYAFNGCPNIRHIVLGESIKRITNPYPDSFAIETAEIYCSQTGTLADRTSLRSVVIGGNRTKISGNMFSGCVSLTEVTITAPIQIIESGAFENCLALKSIQLPDTVTEIGIGAFAGSGIEKITIPAAVSKMSWSVFSNSQVKEIVFMGDMPNFVNNNTFSSATATVYYPAGNSTWDPDKLQEQKGNITWVAQ